MRTSYKRFLKVLAMPSDARWQLQQKLVAVARGRGYSNCPITHVAYILTGVRYGSHKWKAAAQAIGLNRFTAWCIVLAADNVDIGFEPWRLWGVRCKHLKQAIADAAVPKHAVKHNLAAVPAKPRHAPRSLAKLPVYWW